MATTTVAAQTKWLLYKQEPVREYYSSVVLVSTYCRSGILTSVNESESTATTDDKTATVQYKPVTQVLLATKTDYEQPRRYDQISHALSTIHGLCGCSCNFLDIIPVYSLNPGKLPGRFSYK